MKRRRWILGVAILVGLGTAAAGLMLWVRHQCKSGSCETEVPGDEAYDKNRHEPEDLFQKPFLSHPSLAKASSNEIRTTVLDTDGKVARGVPYVVLLSDGRWVSGYTDDDGTTQPVYSEARSDFVLYCCQEAYDFFDRHRADGGGRNAAGDSGSSDKQKNCVRVDAGARVAFRCSKW